MATLESGRVRTRTLVHRRADRAEIDGITQNAVNALEYDDVATIGELMNTNHGFLRRICT
jgi:mevalonate kinase